MQNYQFAPLVPELIVSDIVASVRFYCDALGFRIVYETPEDRFAYLERGPLQIMLDEGREWEVAPMEQPFGRGNNIKMIVDSIAPVLASLGALNWPLFRQPEDRWYPNGDVEGGNRQFLVQDPDGYLLRFSEDLGTRQVQSPFPAGEGEG